MYVCVCMYICVCMDVCVCLCMCLCMYVCVCMYMYIYIYIYYLKFKRDDGSDNGIPFTVERASCHLVRKSRHCI